MMDDNDGQMISGDLGSLKLPEICLTGEENPERNSPRKLVPTGTSLVYFLKLPQKCLNVLLYTQLHKWLPEVNKQKFTHPPMLQVGVAIGGVAVEAEFVF